MKTLREILLKRHQPVEPKLDRMWDESLAPSVAAVCDRRESEQRRREVGTPFDLTQGRRRAPLQFVAWKLWRELILPSRRIWAGLACVWVVIAVLNLASSEPVTEVAHNAKPPSREELRALIEQRQMLAQLIGPLTEPTETHKSNPPGPRSERVGERAAVC
jgi:hypothetical protein